MKQMTIFEYDNGERSVKLEAGAYVSDAHMKLEVDGRSIFVYDILPRLTIHIAGRRRMLALRWLRLNLYSSITL